MGKRRRNMSSEFQASNSATPAGRAPRLPRRGFALMLAVCTLEIVPQLRAQIETMKSSTVMIRCVMPDGVPVPGNPDLLMYKVNRGSGFAVGDSRHVATNHHVVSTGDCSVVLADGRKINGRVVAD